MYFFTKFNVFNLLKYSNIKLYTKYQCIKQYLSPLALAPAENVQASI